MHEPSAPSNQALLLPYLLPYVAYTGIASLPADWGTPAANYTARLLVTAPALLWALRFYVPLRGPSPVAGSLLIGCGVGLLGTALWVGALGPFVDPGGRAWTDEAFGLRLLAAVALVPLFEEQLMRGYVLRLLLQWQEERRERAEAFAEVWERRSVHEVLAGAASPLAVLGSSAVFALGHAPAAWPAAALYGLLMAGLWIVRKDLLSCVAAHATTNLCLALWVRASGHWNLW